MSNAKMKLACIRKMLLKNSNLVLKLYIAVIFSYLNLLLPNFCLFLRAK